MSGARTLGVAVVGVGGAVSSTMVAGLELLRRGLADTTGLPLAEADAPGLVGYDALRVAGWDVRADDLASAAAQHAVLEPTRLEPVRSALAAIEPWPAAGDPNFCRNVVGDNLLEARGKRAIVESIRSDLRRLADEIGAPPVMLNIASTERALPPETPAYQTLSAFEAAVDADAAEIGPAMLYAYAALLEGVPYGNFTPSVAAEIPALVELARQRGVPLAGKDGKTGQTLLKTVLAPALRDRALRVDGWYSTNILGNRDGQALEDPSSLASKLGTKGDVLDSILGYTVTDHVVRIDYYRPRGDDKEAWDNIDVTGFLGRRMQLKVNFLCRDSILAAPLAIELARCLDLARQRGESGPIDALGTFFKAPTTSDGPPVHDFCEQQRRFRAWLRG